MTDKELLDQARTNTVGLFEHMIEEEIEDMLDAVNADDTMFLIISLKAMSEIQRHIWFIGRLTVIMNGGDPINNQADKEKAKEECAKVGDRIRKRLDEVKKLAEKAMQRPPNTELRKESVN